MKLIIIIIIIIIAGFLLLTLALQRDSEFQYRLINAAPERHYLEGAR